MKKKLFIVFLLTVEFFLFAQLVSNEFIVINNINNEVMQLGDPLSKVINQCPDLLFRGKKEYTNITFKEYEGDGIIFSVSASDGTRQFHHPLLQKNAAKESCLFSLYSQLPIGTGVSITQFHGKSFCQSSSV